jgi:ParB family transcriptional regulator, chromosome partitioning protein
MSQPQSGKLEVIPLGQIRPSATNPRKNYDPHKFDELKKSIQQSGITVPLTVRLLGNAAGVKSEPRYELIAGYRRYLAAKDLKLSEVPAIVHELMNDATARDWQMIENLQREDIHPMEEAAGFRAMMDAAKENLTVLTQSALALRLGKSEKHVAERLALLKLIPAGATLYQRNDISLGHALQIAKLEPADQERAVRWLIDPSNSRSSLTLEVLMRDDTTELPKDHPGHRYQQEAKAREEKARAKMPEEQRAMEDARDASRERSTVTATEKALQGWIRANCLLRLDGVPWKLDDPFPEAMGIVSGNPVIQGPCIGCAYRTLTNPALFSDVAGENDMCTHPPCYQAKQKVSAQRVVIQAEEEERPYVKLSKSESHKPVMVKDGATLKAGQWVELGKRKCGAAVTGVFIDGPRQGQTMEVCPDQKCKVHKHQVERPAASGQQSAGESYEARRKRAEAEREALAKKERPVRKAVFEAVMAEVEVYDGLEFMVAQNRAAKTAATLYTKGDTNQRMVRSLVHADIEDELEPNYWRLTQRNGMKDDRAKLWAAAKHFGVDADAIAKRIEQEQKVSAGSNSPRDGGNQERRGRTGVGAAAQPAAKKPAKGAARKPKAKAPKPPNMNGRLTPEQRKRIAAVQKKRWEQMKSAKPAKKKLTAAQQAKRKESERARHASAANRRAAEKGGA